MNAACSNSIVGEPMSSCVAQALFAAWHRFVEHTGASDRIVLSTSTLSSDVIVGGGFGPVNDDCYAVGYGIRPHGCEAQVMTYGRDSQGFADSLQDALARMREAATVEV